MLSLSSHQPVATAESWEGRFFVQSLLDLSVISATSVFLSEGPDWPCMGNEEQRNLFLSASIYM